MAVEHILCKVSLNIYGKNPMHRHESLAAFWPVGGMTSPESPRRCARTTSSIWPNVPTAARGRSFHRSLDVTLAVLTSLAVFFFLFALAVLKHIKPLEHVAFNVFGLDIADTYHMLVSAGIAGLGFSVIALLLVLTATPAPSYLGGIAVERAKLIEERLPAAMAAIKAFRSR